MTGDIFGAVMQPLNQNMAYTYENKTAEKNIERQKDMAQFMYGLEMRKFKNTGYEAQVEQMKSAGLNPALMYGHAGGSGQSTTAGSGDQRGSQAPPMINSGIMEIALLKAQQELLTQQAETEKAKQEDLKANADATGGYRKNESIARTTDLTQGVENKKAQEELTRVQTGIENLNKKLFEDTYEWRLGSIEKTYDYQIEQVEELKYRNEISEQTYQTTILKMNYEYVKMQVEKRLLDETVKNVKADTRNKIFESGKIIAETFNQQQQVKKSIQDIAQGWEKLSQEQKKINIEKLYEQYNTDWFRSVEKILGVGVNVRTGGKK